MWLIRSYSVKVNNWEVKGTVWKKGSFELRPILFNRHPNEATYRLYINGKRSVGYASLETGIRSVERRLKADDSSVLHTGSLEGAE